VLQEVTQRFNLVLREIFPKNLQNREELVKFVLNHERKVLCIQNLCAQIQAAEGKISTFNVNDWKDLIRETARMFANAAIEAQIALHTSSAEKARQASIGSEYDEIRSCIKELDPDEEEGNARPIGGDPGSEGPGMERLRDNEGTEVRRPRLQTTP